MAHQTPLFTLVVYSLQCVHVFPSMMMEEPVSSNIDCEYIPFWVLVRESPSLGALSYRIDAT